MSNELPSWSKWKGDALSVNPSSTSECDSELLDLSDSKSLIISLRRVYNLEQMGLSENNLPVYTEQLCFKIKLDLI